MNKRALSLAIAVPLLSAILGNIFMLDSITNWYANLNHPWLTLPLWGSMIVALLIYVAYGIVIYRLFDQGFKTATALTAAVIIGNEIWNLFFFGMKNLTVTFWVTVIFAILVLIQTLNVKGKDKLSFRISTAYLAWVVLYDLPWLYLLSVMNKTSLLQTN